MKEREFLSLAAKQEKKSKAKQCKRKKERKEKNDATHVSVYGYKDPTHKGSGEWKHERKSKEKKNQAKRK